MKAIVSGQAGVGVLIEQDAYAVFDIEHPEQFLHSDSFSLWRLFADADDIAEIDVANRDEAFREMRWRWNRDRALRLLIILLDTNELPTTRRAAARIAERHLEDPKVWQFVIARLYSSSLPDGVNMTATRELASAGGHNTLRLMDEVASDQQRICIVRDAWDRLGIQLFNSPEQKRSLEHRLICEGAFCDVVKEARTGHLPDRLLEQLVSRLGNDEASARRVLPSWITEIEIGCQAIIAIQALTDVQGFRISRYARQVIAALGSRARGRNHEEFVRAAAIESLRDTVGKVATTTFYETLLSVLPRTFVSWHQGIWQSVMSLSSADLFKLRTYARWRIKGLGQRAEGRSPDDLFQEAVTSTLSGARVWPEDVDLVTHLIGAMRSISSNWGARRPRVYLESDLTGDEETSPIEQASSLDDPAQIYEAKERFEQTRQKFATDKIALEIIDRLSQGFSREEIRHDFGFSKEIYTAAVRRIRRRLAR